MDTQDQFRGDIFPDLAKAAKAKPITDLIAKLLKQDKEIYQVAEDEKQKRRKQLVNDFNSFVISNPKAVEAGNTNSCADKKQMDEIAIQQEDERRKKDTEINLPDSNSKSLYGSKTTQTALPALRTAGAIRGGAKTNRNQSLLTVEFNKAAKGSVTKNIHYVGAVNPSNYTAKASENYKRFVEAHAGKRGRSIGDAAVVFSSNGTPHYGDSYLDKSLQENLSANQATSTPAVDSIPKNIKKAKAIDADALVRARAGQIHPKSDTIGNILALGVVAAAVVLAESLFFPRRLGETPS